VETIDEIAGGSLVKWPKRLRAVPPRISGGSIKGITAETVDHDNQIWDKRVSNYGIYISLGQAGKYRNVMDMNAGIGGFAAAMSKYPAWVMNVVPVKFANDTLGIIYERGLIGTYMDWYVICFSHEQFFLVDSLHTYFFLERNMLSFPPY